MSFETHDVSRHFADEAIARFRNHQEMSPSARLNLLAAGQSLVPSSSIRREIVVTGLDLSGALDPRRPINPTDALKIEGVIAATQTDLEGLVVQGLVASARANAGFGDLVGKTVELLVASTHKAMDTLSAGGLRIILESQTTTERDPITDGHRVLAPASREQTHTRREEMFPEHTSLQAGGGTVKITGIPIREAVFKAAAASLEGRADHRDLSGDPHVAVTDHSAEASCVGNGVVVASAASVQIGAPSATITLGPTTILRG